MTNKYLRLQDELARTGTGTMKCFGTSMVPLLQNGTLNTYKREDAYAVGDIVFCKVMGRFIDAHLVTKIGPDGRCMIANNHGHENGWTRQVFARVVSAVAPSGAVSHFSRRAG